MVSLRRGGCLAQLRVAPFLLGHPVKLTHCSANNENSAAVRYSLTNLQQVAIGAPTVYVRFLESLHAQRCSTAHPVGVTQSMESHLARWRRIARGEATPPPLFATRDIPSKVTHHIQMMRRTPRSPQWVVREDRLNE